MINIKQPPPTNFRRSVSEHGAKYGLCQIYDNEPWHYELRPKPSMTAARPGMPTPPRTRGCSDQLAACPTRPVHSNRSRTTPVRDQDLRLGEPRCMPCAASTSTSHEVGFTAIMGRSVNLLPMLTALQNIVLPLELGGRRIVDAARERAHMLADTRRRRAHRKPGQHHVISALAGLLALTAFPVLAFLGWSARSS